MTPVEKFLQYTSGHVIGWDEFEAVLGLPSPPHAPPGSGDWMKYLRDRNDARNRFNRSLRDEGLSERDFYQIIPVNVEIEDPDSGESIGVEYKLQILKGAELANWHVSNGNKRIEGATKNMRRRCHMVKSNAHLPPQLQNKMNAMLAVVDIHERLCIKAIEKWESGAFRKHKELPESSLRLLVDDATDEALAS